jgi:hypothetical protein
VEPLGLRARLQLQRICPIREVAEDRLIVLTHFGRAARGLACRRPRHCTESGDCRKRNACRDYGETAHGATVARDDCGRVS